MAGPGDEIAANSAGRGHLRASHADREHVVGVLTTAFVLGMLTKHEFDQRIGQVLASRTYAELAALMADIPPGTVPAQPLSVPQRDAPDKHAPDRKALKAWTCVTATFTAVAAVVAAASAGNVGVNEIIVATFVPLVAMLVGVLVAFHAWLDRRAGRRSARGSPPRAAGASSLRRASAEASGQLPPVRGRRHTAEARRSRSAGGPSSRWPSMGARSLGRRCAIG
jgi:Domain of unknown function (DUF1707)